jgi:N-hydroxyarylamine O-acetyltransferase
MAFDLAAYLQRIALKDVMPSPDPDGLRQLQRAHRLAIPFENLDMALGRSIAIDGDAVFDKLVTRNRGGYCFEQNRLFLDALAALGFDARPLLARVVLSGAEPVPARTHTISLVTFRDDAGNETQWIADPGFGGSYSPPMPLAEGETAEAPDGALYRLARDPLHGWMLSRNGRKETTDGRGDASGWQDQFAFALDPVFPADLAMSNHFVQTSPLSSFANRLVVNAPLPHGFAQILNRRYKRANAEETTESDIDDPRVYRIRLGLLFGIQLTAEEVDALGLFEPR